MKRPSKERIEAIKRDMFKPVLCTNCQAKLPKLWTRRNRANEALFEAGKTYWADLSSAFKAVDNAITANGFPTMNEGTDEAGTADAIHINLGARTWLHVSWYRRASGRYELTAYVN